MKYPSVHPRREISIYRGGVELNSLNSLLATKMGELAPGPRHPEE